MADAGSAAGFAVSSHERGASSTMQSTPASRHQATSEASWSAAGRVAVNAIGDIERAAPGHVNVRLPLTGQSVLHTG